MRLTDLLQGSGDVLIIGRTAIEITGIASDSRAVRPGYLFAGLPGGRADGADFVAEAVARGAAAVLVARERAGDVEALLRESPVAVIGDDDPRRRFALIAARFFGAQPEGVAAVTGTNGKTSVAWFLRRLWTACGRRAACLGTLGIAGPEGLRPGGLTTPDPLALHAALAALARDGVERLALEASSHGLDQRRLDGVRIEAGGFTNLTRDHLDYHGNLDAYLAAKLRLFATVVADGGAAVINADDPVASRALAAAEARGLRVLTFGRTGRDLRLAASTARAGGQRLEVEILGVRREIDLPLSGSFQASNALCAAGLAIALGEEADRVASALETLEPAPGRLQAAGAIRGGRAFVDYAHTPDALATVLRALRPAQPGRLIVVFGCGGDRDRGKRPEMGAIAASLADLVIVTDDNPRSEDAAAIRAEILAGVDAVRRVQIREIGDRAAAIGEGVAALGEGDVLLVAGKGHETGQIVGDRILPFDDAAALHSILDGEATR